jgi:hypothetical protein
VAFAQRQRETSEMGGNVHHNSSTGIMLSRAQVALAAPTLWDYSLSILSKQF